VKVREYLKFGEKKTAEDKALEAVDLSANFLLFMMKIMLKTQ
jgi:hypothetical protein